MIKKLSILFLLLISFMCLIVPTPVYAEDDGETTETGTSWTDEDGNVYQVNSIDMTDSSIENGKFMPSSVTGQKFEGSGTVVDFTQTETKTFYTISTADDKIFYLIIDNTKDNNNVYFTREVNEDELNLGVQYEIVNNSPYAEDEVVQVEKVEKKQGLSTKSIVIIGLFVVAGLFYFLISKNKINIFGKKKESSNTSVDIPENEMYGNEDEDFADINFDEENSSIVENNEPVEEVEIPQEQPIENSQEKQSQPSDNNSSEVEFVKQEEEDQDE